MRKLLRGVAYTALPAELVLVVCLLSAVQVPAGVLLAAEALVLAVVLAELAVFVRLRRHGRTAREAVAELVPEPVLRLVGHELRVLASLGRWAARRRHGVGAGDLAFGHAKAQAALLWGFAFVCVVETVGLHVLLAGVPVVRTAFLVVDVYTVVLVVGLHAAAVTRPHVVRQDGGLRVRAGAHVDLDIPAERIASVRYELRLNPGQKEDGLLELAVASQTSVTVELTEPGVQAVSLLGKRRRVTTVRFHADDGRGLVREARRVRAEAEAEAEAVRIRVRADAGANAERVRVDASTDTAHVRADASTDTARMRADAGADTARMRPAVVRKRAPTVPAPPPAPVTPARTVPSPSPGPPASV